MGGLKQQFPTVYFQTGPVQRKETRPLQGAFRNVMPKKSTADPHIPGVQRYSGRSLTQAQIPWFIKQGTASENMKVYRSHVGSLLECAEGLAKAFGQVPFWNPVLCSNMQQRFLLKHVSNSRAVALSCHPSPIWSQLDLTMVPRSIPDMWAES